MNRPIRTSEQPQPLSTLESNDAERPQEILHRRLMRWNRIRLEPSFPAPDWRANLEGETRLRILEDEFLESERAAIRAQAEEAPESGVDFMAWFAELLILGPGQGDPLFPWLAQHASMDQMRWFLSQEAAGEAGFDDLVAMSQVKLPPRSKLELARNYWDEMGCGQSVAMHGNLLEATVAELGLRALRHDTVWETTALSNLMIGLAFNRRYAYHSIGALGVVEMTAPGRVSLVNEGLKRLGIPSPARQYYALHASLDVKHSAGWNAEAIQPLVQGNPWIAKAMAEGALMRLWAGRRCFDRYRAYFGI
jgi:heme oxygenase-like protein